MLSDMLVVAAASLCATLLSEGMSWVLIYRTPQYKRLQSEIERTQKKLDRRKEAAMQGGAKKVNREKKLEEDLQTYQRDMSFVKMKSMVAVAVIMITMVGLLNSEFEGKVVAKLPFVPFGIIQTISHRNLLGDDMTDCSVTFFYIICGLAIRGNIQKYLGRANDSKGFAQMFAPPQEET